MAEIIFLATILSTFLLLLKIIVLLIKKRCIKKSAYLILKIVGSYSLLWLVSFMLSKEEIIAPNTDICFDDWCATLVSYDKPESIGSLRPQGQFIVLHIKMSNHARGRAQKPSEPRVKIIEGENSYSISQSGQQEFETIFGKQTPIETRLELHQALETTMVFDVPNEAQNLKVIIDEGPLFITKIISAGDKKVFQIN